MSRAAVNTVPAVVRWWTLFAHLQQIQGFVLLGGSPASGFRWSLPESASSSEALGGGLGYVVSTSFCDEMIARFPERDLIRGLNLGSSLQFVHCNDIVNAIQRGFATWTLNHRLISFVDLGATFEVLQI